MADWIPRLGFTLFPFIGSAYGRAITKKNQEWYDVSDVLKKKCLELTVIFKKEKNRQIA